MAGAFAIMFMGKSYPVPSTSMVQIDATHWVLDVCTAVTPDYGTLRDVCLFLTQPGALDPSCGLALYVAVGGQDWQFRGGVSAAHPSETMPLRWPRLDATPGPGVVQVGVSVEPLSDLEGKVHARVAEKADFARLVAMDLYRYLSSFSTTVSLPTDLFGRWLARFQEKFQRDPDFLTRNADTA